MAPQLPTPAQPYRPGDAPSGFTFLPSTPPPGTVVPETAVSRSERVATPGWGWRAVFAFVAGGLVAAAGFAVALTTTEDEAATPPTETPIVETTNVPATPSIVVEPPDVDTSEPVAFVAQVLGPSVVQIEIPQVGLGSGVVFADGLILTNHHVVDGSVSVDVRTSDGRLLQGEVLGSDARTDIAVVSVGVGSGLPIAQLAVGDELEVGQLTIAIGSPFQLQQTVTSGIISSLNRPVFNGIGLNAMIQTDAAINPGNSGGALADRSARVIGINTAIQTDGLSTGNVGVGFAVPIDTAMNIAGRIIAGEEMVAGFLGVVGGASTDGSAGVTVSDVTAQSSADTAGIEVGDRIVTIDGAPITSIEELAGLVQTRFPGDVVELEVFRDGQRITIAATLGER